MTPKVMTSVGLPSYGNGKNLPRAARDILSEKIPIEKL